MHVERPVFGALARLASKYRLKYIAVALLSFLLIIFSFHIKHLDWHIRSSSLATSTISLNYHCKTQMRPRCNYSTLNRCCAVMLKERQGRLGNRMFMFASALGIALTYHCQLIIHQNILDELKTVFTIDLNKVSDLQVVESMQIRSCVDRKYNYCNYFPINFQKNRYHVMELTGFWQSYRYFYTYKRTIQTQFSFKSSIKQKVEIFFRDEGRKYSHHLNALRENQKDHGRMERSAQISSLTWVGIHVRRGDFLHLRQVSSKYFIDEAIYYFEKRYSNIIFLMTSDDKAACQDMYGNHSNLVITPVSFSAGEDLAALAACDHMIVTVGTFGWWAAFLGSGQVLHDIKFSKNPTPVDNNCTQKNYLPPSFFSFNKTF